MKLAGELQFREYGVIEKRYLGKINDNVFKVFMDKKLTVQALLSSYNTKQLKRVYSPGLIKLKLYGYEISWDLQI